METLIQHTVKKELDGDQFSREQQCICNIIDLVNCDPSVLEDHNVCNTIVSELWDYVENQCDNPLRTGLQIKSVHFTESFCDALKSLLETLLDYHQEGEHRLLILFLLYEIELVHRRFEYTGTPSNQNRLMDGAVNA
ncbi:hypothetical protein [Terasakiella sp. SH-1]|uniref:hypothetical protein n=1 Tax=Terasakiella sp. SH-1 TaxID=2560057 RepID=UPI0010734459|nr:hypothetical protein [Terasakiella sp. SH-1]